MAPEERLWRYRISIYSAQVRDEGEFTCATPRGHSNSIRIIVRSISLISVSIAGFIGIYRSYQTLIQPLGTCTIY